MNHIDLFSGIAVVIDDEIGKKGDIDAIIKQLRDNNIPLLSYLSIPETEVYKNFHNVSFVLLDWQLTEGITQENTLDGVKIQSRTQERLNEANVAFINDLRNVCFAPVFIFTNETPSKVTKILKKAGLYFDNTPNYIFIESKDNLKNDNKVMKAIYKWISGNPPVYVLKEWEKSLRIAKTKMYFDFYQCSPSWSRILWNNYQSDGVNPSDELGNFIARNLFSRLRRTDFDKSILQDNSPVDAKSVAKVLESTIYIENDALDPSAAHTGDLFFGRFVNDSKDHFWLNIRANCDTIMGRGIEEDSIILYCIRGEKKTMSSTKSDGSRIKFYQGQFLEPVNCAVILFDYNHILVFDFNSFQCVKWTEAKTFRIARVIEPYIIRIQQRYALYMHRQGLPRIPQELFSTK